MPISNKIMDQVQVACVADKEKDLMMKILQIEDKGNFRFEAAYEKAIKDFIAERDKKEETT